MGAYDTTYRGEIRIDPPLTWGEIKRSPFLRSSPVDKDVELRVVEAREETDEDTVIRRVADAIVPLGLITYSGYHIIEHVQEILDRHGAGRTFTGRFDCEGSDAGDLWRLEIRDGKAVRVEPRIVWPDEGGEPK